MNKQTVHRGAISGHKKWKDIGGGHRAQGTRHRAPGGMSIIKNAAKCCHFRPSPDKKSTKSHQELKMLWRQEGRRLPAPPPTRADQAAQPAGGGTACSRRLSWLLACNSHVLARTFFFFFFLCVFCWYWYDCCCCCCCRCCWHFDLSI